MTGRVTAKILVVDDDLGTRETCYTILQHRGFEVLTAHSGEDALQHAKRALPDLILCDLRLPDLSGLDVLRRLQHDDVRSPFLIMTGFGTIASAIEAMRLGASEYLEKPLDEEDILSAVYRCLSQSARHSLPEPHPINRWSQIVLAVLDASEDPKTLQKWCVLAHAARATLENWCHVASLPPKASLDFARVLRAVVRSKQLGWKLEHLLDVDPRTFERLVAQAGLSLANQDGHCCTPMEFLSRQTFITDQLALDVIRRALSGKGIDTFVGDFVDRFD